MGRIGLCVFFCLFVKNIVGASAPVALAVPTPLPPKHALDLSGNRNQSVTRSRNGKELLLT